MHVDGDCGLGESLPLTSLIPEQQLEGLLGAGDYTASPGLVVKSGKVPAEFGGQCTVSKAGGGSRDLLSISLIPKSDPGYASYQSTLGAGDLAEKLGSDGYVVSEHAEDAAGPDAPGARAAIVEPERVVVLRVLVPAESADTVKQAGVAVRSVADNLHHLG